MNYLKAYDGSVIAVDEFIKAFELTTDDAEGWEFAFLLVCKYITKRDIKKLHRSIIKNICHNDMSINLAPRGFGKSTVGDVDYCIMRILKDPNIRIMIGSKTQTQSEAFLKEIRTHFEQNQDLIMVFGDLKGDKWTDKEFTVSSRTIIKKEATVTALGASGAVVSKHFDLIIGDDLVGFENARTETQRNKLREWFYSSLTPTLEPHGQFHILGTRYHPLDLYTDLINSARYSVSTQKAINKINGEEVSLWESKFSLEKLKEIRRESGSIIFAMQYQNDVELAKGNIFKPQYFRYYGEWRYSKDVIEVKYTNEITGVSEWRYVKVFIGVDLAISQNQSADYTVIMAIGLDEDGNIYVLDYLKERLSFNKQLMAIIRYAEQKFPMVERLGVESVAYQDAMVQELQRGTVLPVKGIKTNRDKVSRAQRRSALFENGKVFFRENMSDLEECLLLFPDVEHDDLFDGLDLAISVIDETNKVRVLDRGNFRI